MKAISRKALTLVEQSFKTKKGYLLSKVSSIYCPQVNGLTNVCLAELGYAPAAAKSIGTFKGGDSFIPKLGLFYREVSHAGEIISSQINTCKNSVFALALTAVGDIPSSKKLLIDLKNSPAYLSTHNLFGREYDLETSDVNSLIITQSNLWAAISFAAVGETEESKQIMRYLESERFNIKNGLFDSQDCKDSRYVHRQFVDDQALAMLVYMKIGEESTARSLADSVLGSPLHDLKSGLFNSSFEGLNVDNTKSTYKNSFMALALGNLGYTEYLKQIQDGLVRELYDGKEHLFNQTTSDNTKVPDNTALAVLALEYERMRHLIF